MFTILRHSITIKRIKWYFHAARDAALTGNIIMLSFVYYFIFFLSSGFVNRKDDSYVVMKSCDEEKGIFHLFYIFFFLF